MNETVITTPAVMTPAEEVRAKLSARIDAYNALKLSGTASGASLDGADGDIKSTATECKAIARDALTAEFLSMGEYDMMVKFMMDRSFTYDAPVQDKATGLYSIESKTAELAYSHLESAYWNLNKRKLYGADNYAVLARILAYKCRAVVRECGKDKGHGETMTATDIGALSKDDSRKLDDLKRTSPAWAKTSKNGLAVMMEEFRKALFPDWFETPAYLRNDDRWNLAVKFYGTHKDKKSGLIVFDTLPNADKVISLYFDAMRMAYEEATYTTVKTGVSATADPAPADADPAPADPAPADADPAPADSEN